MIRLGKLIVADTAVQLLQRDDGIAISPDGCTVGWVSLDRFQHIFECRSANFGRHQRALK